MSTNVYTSDGASVCRLIATILVYTMVLHLGCRNQGSIAQPTPRSTPAFSQSLESVHISELWKKERSQLNRTSKDYPAKQLQLLQTLMEQLSLEQQNSEFERIRSAQISHKKMSDFDQNLLQLFVIWTVQKQDRAKLVYLLSAQCPRFISTDAIELYVGTSSLPDSLLIFFDSYEKAEGTRAHDELLDVFNNVFWFLRNAHSDDNEFLKASKEWYLKNKDKLKINPLYQPNSDFSESRSFFVNVTASGM